ncbi:MAG: HAD-IA family hydrolase [Burkholderiaceae bacterium]
MKPATVLVLDFGGVISRTLFETHALTELALGLAPGTLDWRGPFDPDSDSLWQRMQAGEITERQYWLTRSAETGERVGQQWSTMQEFVIAARGAEPMAVVRPECLQAVQKAKSAGARLAILSNELDLFYGVDFRTRLPLLEKFELIVDATYTGVLKPDPKAYNFITDGLCVDASTCVFVDDQKRNIDGAIAVGMQTVHFDVQAPQQSFNFALAALGINTD